MARIKKGIWVRLRQKLKYIFGGEQFLCDSCAFDLERYCRNPKRPNVTECMEYKKR